MTRLQVIVPVAAQRAAAAHDAPLDNEALWGEIFILQRKENGFGFGMLAHDGYEGWIDLRCLGHLPDATATVAVPMTIVTQTSDIKSQSLFSLSFGSKLHHLGTVGDQAEIVTTEGRGFVPACHILPQKAYVRDWVAVAESFTASPYKWGGRSAFGLDCSALVQLSMAAGGMAVPRDSGPQKEIGTSLELDASLKRGDLIFWDGHVGIMTTGETLLHANAYHMAVVCEPLRKATTRIAKAAGDITAIRRPS